VYAGLLTVLLRLVFLLYAEDRDLLSRDPVYVNHYSVTGLFDRLRADAGRYPDTMDQRYGAWAQLLTLFRLVHDGAAHERLRLPTRHGYLFNPDRYNFLEGRPWRVGRVLGERIDPPLVSDGVVYRVLQNLMLLDGERVSYRTLDVEQIGSVYETMMGFDLRVARGRSIAVKATKPHGAPTTLDLDALLEVPPEGRAKRLREWTDQTLTGQALERLKAARTPEDVVAALERKIARHATPGIVPPGAMILQPSDERRRSGSHYTPRSLTEPIVRTALRPILEQLGDTPRPEQILDLKVCDPAMGSGAFLVEVCRQLGEALAKAWHAHGCLPSVPPDEIEGLHAQRLIAQRCLYGVDKNPLATDLAKLSLWLATLAKDHAFTFLDHALRTGDSLVGLTSEQVAAFDWRPRGQMKTVGKLVLDRLEQAATLRRQIQAAGDDTREDALRDLLWQADATLHHVRLVGDTVVAAFFGADTAKAREACRTRLAEAVQAWLDGRQPDAEVKAAVASLIERDRPVTPFHWEVEFPEVFRRDKSGFDAVVGNPPFSGKNGIIASNAPGYLDWLQAIHEEAHGNADLVAHFFRRAFTLVRDRGAFGLIATNTIGQGDTRTTGLRWICTHRGTIYSARRRLKWPGHAAVVVSVVHAGKGPVGGPYELDGCLVDVITAYLFHAGGHDNPAVLKANAGKSFQGSIVLGMGFTFDDTDAKGVATPIVEMRRLIEKDPRNAERIFPYIGGDEVNSSPNQAHHRYVINFGEMTEAEARQWPDLMRIVEEKVKPERLAQNDRGAKEKWWQFIRPRPELHAAIRDLERVLVNALYSPYLSFVFLQATQVFSNKLNVMPFDGYGVFAVLQSRVHEVWARFFSATLKDDLAYAPTDCFETFPFAEGWEQDPRLEEAGRAYYEFRAALMVKNDEGLTKTYNRFHDPEEWSADIVKLRELHGAMDRAVLDAYAWTGIQPTWEFLLDYEEEEQDGEQEGGRARKKPWRYRWPDETRDEVLARLLALNQERAAAERVAGARVGHDRPRRHSRRSPKGAGAQLFEE